jgi:hypothetical protein
MPEAKHPSRVAAERKVGEIVGQIHYDTTSLTHALVKAFRNGMPAEKATGALDLIAKATEECRAAFAMAIAQPENNLAKRPEVNL